MTLAASISSIKSLSTCSLCGLSTLHPLTNDRGDVFCCPSCKEVSALLEESPAKPTVLANVADVENLTLTLGGMWCSSCAWLVGEQLKRTKGVASADVNFIQQQANLTYDASITNPKLLKKRIKALGYKAILPNEKPYDEEESFYMRLLIGGVMVLHDMIVGAGIYAREIFGWATPESQPLVDFFQVMMLVTSIPVLLLLGLPILRAGFASLLRGQPNLHTLITIGTFSAFGLSVYHLIVGQGGLYFDTVTMLIFLVSVGRWLEMQAHKSSNKAVMKLLEQIPDTATVVTNEADKDVSVSDLKPGMRLRVRPGARFPVDGLIASGEGDVDESLLTGEPRPASHREGDAVKAGTINLDGSFEVIATAVGESTMAGQIGRLLHEALWARSPLERLVDKLSAWMTPAALTLAAIAFLIWNAISGFEQGLLVALSVLLIACPCALGLATPLTLWLSLERAAESGAILRSTASLERLAKVEKVFFDKTGTLSQLPMKVQGVFSNSAKFLQIVASVENGSEHPLAKAIVEYAKSQGIELIKPESFKFLPALGVVGRLPIANDRSMIPSLQSPIYIGSARLMSAEGLTMPEELSKQAEAWREAGLVIVYAGWDGQVVGVVGLGETIRAEAKEVMTQLQSRGLELGVLTGDESSAGERWQRTLGVPVQAALMPDEKMRRLSQNAAMVGDGINDGPALAAATVGLAMNHGTDVARTAADIVLMRDDLKMVPWLIDLSRESMKRVRQNLGWAVVYNLVGVALAMAGLLQPVFSAFAMVASSIFVTSNAMKMNNYPLLDGNDPNLDQGGARKKPPTS
ncbi:MAG: copper-exporting P-type ATPase A [Anaerolineaceae bacterium]|nr:MAG: copper-exporting P-type ATPase A [Anaerolineaceae bacterium]